MNILEQVKKFPLSPGVYIFKDKEGEPLYVGRATSLRRRVLQYFRKDIDRRIGEMVSLAEKVDFLQTETVLECIILEANLIKKYWPKYNVKDKDNRSFIFLVIPKTDFSKPIIVRGRELQSFPVAPDRVFGPFQSYLTIRTVLKIVRRIFPYSVCRAEGKPCFDYQVGLCPGVCVGAISKKEYQKNINNMLLLFRGEKNKLVKKLSKENPEAAVYLKNLQDVTLISRDDLDVSGHFNRIEGYDISHFAGKEVYGSMVVFTNGQPDNKEYRLFKIKTVTNNDLDALKEMLERRLKHTEWPKPDLILIDGGKPQIDYLGPLMEQYQFKGSWLGLSKLNGDHLVYPARTKNVFKDLAETIKRTLQQVRDEAHRFANRGRSKGYFNKNLR
jgi:excinuclease ABC subunit C